ncbi:MAG TPA: PEP-CTERM sorting domain-containing protein [Opitutaceae bacterium]|nr:PEP-CTERM sorting domain-containing protein [Opitutaceae bacterium]
MALRTRTSGGALYYFARDLHILPAMTKLPALSRIACLCAFSFGGIAASHAQITYESSKTITVVATNGPGVFTTENTGVAVKALFKFDHQLGYLEVKLTNLSGTAKPGGGHYTDGILVGFGFDGPAGLLYKSNSFTQLSFTSGEPGGVDFDLGNGFSMSGGLGGAGNGTFDFGAGVDGADGNGTGGSPSPGIAGGGPGGGYSATFRFRFKGDLTHFNADDFFEFNGADADLGFRFKAVGDCDEDSEKVVYFVEDSPNAPPIPEPSTYGLLAAGLLVGVAGLKRYRARRTAGTGSISA